jgi:hypothetical protein
VAAVRGLPPSIIDDEWWRQIDDKWRQIDDKRQWLYVAVGLGPSGVDLARAAAAAVRGPPPSSIDDEQRRQIDDKRQLYVAADQ